MNETRNWDFVWRKGKKYFVLVNSFYLALSFVLLYSFLHLIRNHHRAETFYSASFSGVVIDYVAEGIFWLIAAWAIIAFFSLLIWHQHENK